ncbi:MAG: PhnA domain-containing protein [Mycoplasmataceae bacterium]|nr:PhnA domain-containing protein [Mycoplasmataceae bacterium]
MNTEQTLMQRSNSACELCNATNDLSVYSVPPTSDSSAEQAILACKTCLDQIEMPDTMNSNHWRCLNDAMWKPEPAIQVMAWRLLKRLESEGWANDLLEMLYLEDDVQQWAASLESTNEETTGHKDSNGANLSAGDSVTLIKDLDVKGANFTAKRGTMVKNISLTDNPEQIEGKVNGTRIVLLTKFLKKSG